MLDQIPRVGDYIQPRGTDGLYRVDLVLWIAHEDPGNERDYDVEIFTTWASSDLSGLLR